MLLCMKIKIIIAIFKTLDLRAMSEHMGDSRGDFCDDEHQEVIFVRMSYSQYAASR